MADGDVLFAPTVTRRLIEAYCLGGGIRQTAQERSTELDVLTAREIEVLRLVGTGQSNADIAAGLVVSVGTVKTHFNRTMTKLGLSSRAQAVVLAYESGLVTPRSSQQSASGFPG